MSASAKVSARAVTDEERGFAKTPIQLHPDASRHLAVSSDGDARKALTALEVAYEGGWRRLHNPEWAMQINPIFQSLINEPRFIALEMKIKQDLGEERLKLEAYLAEQ